MQAFSQDLTRQVWIEEDGVDSGTRAAIVLQSKADDQAYLDARGITTLIPVDQIT